MEARVPVSRRAYVLRTACLVAAVAVAVLAPLADARAAEPTKQQCIDANETAQTLRQSGKLAASRAQLLTCVTASCPEAIRNDCSQRLDDLSLVQPTIVFEAKDGAGHDLSAVKVTMDGQPFADRLDGSALPVDPGARSFTFEVAGQPPVTQTFVVHEGERARRERIVIGPSPATSAPPLAPAPPFAIPTPTPNPAPQPQLAAAPLALADTPQKPGSGQRTAALLVGGVGVAGVVVGIVFGALASGSWSSSQSECGSPTSCPNRAQAITDHDSATSSAAISTVGLIAGGALLAGGVALWFTAPTGPRTSSPSSALQIVPTAGPGGGGLSLRGGF